MQRSGRAARRASVAPLTGPGTPLVLAVVAGAGLLLAGCTSSPTSAPAATSAPTPVTTGTSDAPVSATELGARIHRAMTTAGTGKGSVTVTGTHPLAAELELAFPAGSTPSSRTTMTLSGLPIEVLVVAGGTYVKGLPAPLAGGRTWARVESTGTDVVSRAVRELGGVAADPQLAVDAVPGGQASVVDRSAAGTRYAVTPPGGRVADSGVDVLLDGQDRPVRLTVAVSGQTVQVDYRDWGAAVAIAAPASDQVGALSVPTG